jgi:hypothetical protein
MPRCGSIATDPIYLASTLLERFPAGPGLLGHGILAFALPHPLQIDGV